MYVCFKQIFSCKLFQKHSQNQCRFGNPQKENFPLFQTARILGIKRLILKLEKKIYYTGLIELFIFLASEVFKCFEFKKPQYTELTTVSSKYPVDMLQFDSLGPLLYMHFNYIPSGIHDFAKFYA